MTFDLRTKTLFLTYSQADINSDDLYEWTKQRLDIIYAIIAREHHKDGQPHTHAAYRLKSTRRLRNCHEFDFGGHHPNITSARNWDATVNYCKKAGDFKEYGDQQGHISERRRGLTIGDGESYLEYLGRCNSESINL